MNSSIRLQPLLLAGLLLVSPTSYAGAPGESPHIAGFHAELEASYGILKGDITLDLQPGANPGEYDYRMSTKTRGLARLVRSGTGTETSYFEFTDQGIRPLSYALDDGTDEVENDTEIRFDWSAGIAYSVYKETAMEIEIEPGMLDRMSADVMAIKELREGITPGSYFLVDRNSIREYELTAQGEETVKVPAGKFQTVKFLRQRPGSSRSTMIWYAKDLAYLPVRIEQRKHDKAVITMVATVLQPESN